MPYDQRELGKRIRTERIKNKLTIERLCELLEVSPSFIGLVERGTSGISLEKLYRLSEIFHVSTDYLIKGDDSIPPNGPGGGIDVLNAYLYNYTEEEIDFVIELLKFLKPRVTINNTQSVFPGGQRNSLKTASFDIISIGDKLNKEKDGKTKRRKKSDRRPSNGFTAQS